MEKEQLRRRVGPLALAGAFIGLYLTVGDKLPHEHEVALDLGPSAPTVTDVELSWSDPRAPMEEAALTTQWHYAPGTAPPRIRAKVRLANGDWDAEVAVKRTNSPETTHWSRRVNLTGTSWRWRDSLDAPPVVLPVREALR